MLYNGTHTSLYKTLPPAVIPILEDAILKTRVRLDQAAEDIFNNELSAYSHIPIVAIEHAELSLHHYNFPRVLEILDVVPASSFTDSEEDRDVRQLIAVFRATVRVKTEAIYEPAMEELRNLQRSWATKSVDDFTDIQVECVRKYVLICISLGVSSNFITEDMKHFPAPNPTPGPQVTWQGLTDLRVSLISQGRFMEAIRFSTVERAKGTAAESYQVTCLLLKLAMDHRARVIGTKDEIPWCAAMLQLKLSCGRQFASLGAKAEAEVWLSSVEKDLEELIAKINGSTGVLTMADSLYKMSIDFYRLKAVGNEEPTESRFQRILELGESMLAVGHVETAPCHYLAIAWAKKLYSGDQLTNIRTDIQLRTQHLFENVQGQLPEALTNLMDILIPRATNINEVAKNIEMLETFIAKYPQLLLPTALPTMRKQLQIRELLYGQAESRKKQGAKSERAQELQSCLPTGLKIRNKTTRLELDGETLKVKSILDKKDNDDSEFDMLYEAHSDLEQVRVPRLLRKLLVEESVSGILSELAVAQIFGVGESQGIRVRDELIKLTGQELVNKLVGTPESPICQAEWNKRRPALRAWLLDATRPRLPTRQCLWVDLHNVRLRVWTTRGMEGRFPKEFVHTHKVTPETFNELRTPYLNGLEEETRQCISAIEDRLELEEAQLGYTLNHYERETRIVELSLPALFIQIFFCSQILCTLFSDEKLNNTRETALNRAEDVARNQLAYWRSVNNYQFIAQSAVTIATITQYKIECRIVKEIAEINQILEEALGLLEEAESLFGTTLYEIDLSHSLVTLETKVLMGSKMRMWTVGQTAIRLLFHAIQMANDNTKESSSGESIGSHEMKLLKLWQWVQRVKARALSQSIGLDNMAPDVMLAGIQSSINDEKASAEADPATTVDQPEASQVNEAELTRKLEATSLEAASAPPLELLPEVRRMLKESSNISPERSVELISQATLSEPQAYSPEATAKIFPKDILSMNRDMQLAKLAAAKLKEISDAESETKKTLQKRLSEINERISKRPALEKLFVIADFLNREEALLKEIEDGPASDRFQRRIELQRLRKEMQTESVLKQMLRIREGWPVSSQDLLKIASGRNGKVAFVDWFRVSSSFNRMEKLYMLIWRNGICKLIDLETEFKKPRKAIDDFFSEKDVYLPDVDPTPLEDMDLEWFVPKKVDVDKDDVRPVLSCTELVRPLFDNPLVEAGDLLVLSVTEGFHNFPLHAVEYDERGPLILHHPVVCIPSLSVLHKCYWTRCISNRNSGTSEDRALQALVLGGVVSAEPVYQYGRKAIERIGSILNSLERTFVGTAATLSNFNMHISTSNLLHIHLHTNYGTVKDSASNASPKQGHLSASTPEDMAFITSPLNQAITFNDPAPSGELTARQILALKLARGAHINLVGCASGRQGKFEVDLQPQDRNPYNITDEVMGLVPAFLFSGAGSVTSTLWPIQDEHGAVFSHLLFRALVESMGRDVEVTGAAKWVDLAEVHRKAVLEMRRIYKQPSAWAGFILSGYWNFRTG